MSLVVDASVAVNRLLVDGSFTALKDADLLAPPLLWSEVRSALHQALWRGDLERVDAERSLGDLESAPIRASSPRALGRESWRIADRLGLAKTYDAEFLALASLNRCRLVTLDMRLKRGAAALGFVVEPSEL